MQKIYVSSKMLCLRFIKGLSIFLFSISISTFGLCQATNPVPYDLSLGSLIRTGLNPAVSDYPQNIQGWSSGTNNLVVPPASNTTSPLADEPLIINGTSSTFGLSNLGLNGYNFLATSSSPYQQVGAIALSLNTSNRSFLQVTWTAEDQTAGNTREMNLTLQYRIGTTGNFIAISGSTYTSNNFNKKAPTTFSNVLLPNVCNNKPVVQLRWIYFESAGQTGVGVDAIRLDDIYVFSSASLACTPPTIQSLIPNFSVPVLAAATNTITPVITTGDGIGHIIVVKQGSAVTGVPVDGVDYLTGLNTNFSLSTSTIAPGEKVVYSGTGSTTVTGLTPNVIYHFAVFEYSANSCYLTPAGVGNINTLACTTPTAASAAVVSNVTNNAATLSWTNGSSTNRLVVLNAASNVTGVPVDGAAYTANADYSVAPAFTPGTGKIVYNGTGNTVNITGLTNNITYYAQIFEYRAISNCYGIATSTNFSTGIASFVAFDNFDRANNNNVGIPSSMGLTPPAWTEFENAATNATIVSNALQLTSCLAGTCITGKEAISYDMAAQYATTFAFANANLQWHFNMKQSRSTGDLSGFGNSDYGMAFIIGSNEANVSSATADGYAVIMGETGPADPIRLVHFTNGINNYTSIVNVPSPTPKTNYMSVRVTYNPCTGQWGLLVRDDGAVAFQDPLTIAGVEVNAINTTYTNTALQYLGALWNHATTNSEFVFFDNVSIPSGLGTTNTYVWNGSISTDYQVANNWTPARTCPKVNDILVFDASSPAISNVTNVPTQTIGKLLISGNRDVIFKDVSGDAATSFLTIGGGTGTDFSVAAGSTFRFDVAAANNANDAIVITLSSGANALISGTVIFRNSNIGTAGRLHQLFGTDASSIIVANGGLIRAEDLNGEPFGALGASNIVIFQLGSVYESADGNSPFGLNQPASKVIFQTGSLYRHLQTAVPSIFGRSYADFEFNVTGICNVTSGSITGTMNADNFRVVNGTLNITGTFNILQVNVNIKGDLTVSAGATFNYSPGAAAYASTIAFTSTNAIQKINSAGTITFGRFATLELNNTHSTPRLDVETNITIQGTLKVTAGNLNLSTGDITMQSDATSTSNISPVNGIVTYGTGRFIVERYLFGKRAWRLLATPIDPSSSPTIFDAWQEGGSLASTGYGTQISGPGWPAGSLDYYTQRGALKWYDQSLQNYREITNTQDPLVRTEGYYVFVRGNRSVGLNLGAGQPTNLRIRGKINTGTQTPITVGANNFISFGNPYASAIDFRNVSKTNISESFIVWNPNNPGSYNVGEFQTYIQLVPGGDYVRVPGGEVRDTIQSGEAVFIQSVTGGFITLEENDKVGGSRNVSRSSNMLNRVAVIMPTLDINLHTKDVNGTMFLADGVKINFDNSLSNQIDNDDVRKIFNAVDNLAITKNNTKLIVERRKELQPADTIFLHLTSTRVGAYQFQIIPTAWGNEGVDAFLKDTYLQTETLVNLFTITNINFDITAAAASKVADRFMIVCKKALPITKFITINAHTNNDKTNAIHWKVSNENNIANYITERSANGTDFIAIKNNAALQNNNTDVLYKNTDAQPLQSDNYYRIKMTLLNGNIVYSYVVKVDKINNEIGITISPNPVVDKNINIQMANQPKGIYNLHLINSIGQTIYYGRVAVVSYLQTLNIALHKNTPAGNYELIIINDKGEKTVKKMSMAE